MRRLRRSKRRPRCQLISLFHVFTVKSTLSLEVYVTAPSYICATAERGARSGGCMSRNRAYNILSGKTTADDFKERYSISLSETAQPRDRAICPLTSNCTMQYSHSHVPETYVCGANLVQSPLSTSNSLSYVNHNGTLHVPGPFAFHTLPNHIRIVVKSCFVFPFEWLRPLGISTVTVKTDYDRGV
ncbi:hypothetical protein C8Q70DRAFT_258045 [Cubamyces menziesii]|nr:hypothetical protein C8Q70DRAFT_258045 [Cubamyces menziesii]